MAWAIVAAKGKMGQAVHVDRCELVFLAASGIATGASWLLCYYAIATGQVSVVVQIDKLSIVVSVLFARLAFNEKLSRRSAIGLVLSYWALQRSQFGSSAASSRYILTPGLGCLY